MKLLAQTLRFLTLLGLLVLATVAAAQSSNLRRIGFLYDPRSPKEKELTEVREAARSLGMSITAATASSPEAIQDAMASLRRAGAEALVISEDTFTFGNRAIIVALAAEYRTVDIASFREFVDAGGVLSYGAQRHRALADAGALCRQDDSRRQTCGFANRAGDALRVRRQPESRAGFGRHDSEGNSAACR